MLVLSRKINETIIIGGNIRVTMTAIRGRQVRLAIEAPPEVSIVREELLPAPSGDGGERDRSCEPAYRIRRDGTHPARGARPSR
jgi:carbon storage regulator CsrA